MLNFENLKKQAKQIVRWHRAGYHPVAQRIRTGLPRYRQLDDRAILAAPFALAEAQELIACELGFDGWEALRKADRGAQASLEPGNGNQARLLGAVPQLLVTDMEVSCRFFVEKLGFTLGFRYGQPPFYALVQRDAACLNLRFVHSPVLDRKGEPDLLAASIPVENLKALYLAYKAASVPVHQDLKRQPWGARDFIVRDPDGNLIHFSEWMSGNRSELSRSGKSRDRSPVAAEPKSP